MKPVISVFLLLFSLAGQAQKTIHDPNVELRAVTGFQAISISDGIDLYLSMGAEAVAVSAKDPESRAQIRTEVKNGVLVISFEGRDLPFRNQKALKAYVSAPSIHHLSASSGSDIRVDGIWKNDKIALEISGGSDFHGTVEAESLVVEQAGGSDISIKGRATNLIIQAKAGSDFDGFGLETENCIADASGGSDISITVTKEFAAEASGGSDVTWKGSAKIKRSKATGAGSISHRS